MASFGQDEGRPELIKLKLDTQKVNIYLITNMNGQHLSLSILYPAVHAFITIIRELITTRTNDLHGNHQPTHQMVISGGYPLAVLRAIYCNDEIVMGQTFSDFDIFTTYQLQPHDLGIIMQRYGRVKGQIENVEIIEGPEMHYNNTSRFVLASLVKFSVYLAPRSMETSSDNERTAKIDVVTLHPNYIATRNRDMPFWKIVIDSFDISVCRVYMEDEDSDPRALDNKTSLDILNGTFTYRMDNISFSPGVLRRIEKYMDKGYKLRQIEFPDNKALTVGYASIESTENNRNGET